MNNEKMKRQRGFAAVYLTLSSMLLIPLVGLAIDFGVMYTVKSKLQAAVDAAAVGAGGMLQRTTDLTNAATVADIKDAANRFFDANYPTGFWGTSQVYYDSVPSEDVSKVRSVYVHAAVRVPMLFLRVLRISDSVVAAEATTKVRFVTMMIVVDRSGSVVRAGADSVIRNALYNFVAYTPTSTPAGNSIFVNGRDIIGMVSYGGTYNEDLAPTANFRTASPNIATAIGNIPFGNNPTNTAEGLYQGYSRLQALNQTGALNVIVLLTDGRPSAFTATLDTQGTCTVKGNKTGFLTANVGTAWPPLPPQSQGGQQGSSNIYSFGLYNVQYSGLDSSYGDANSFVANSGGCHYYSDSGQAFPGANLYMDASDFPVTDAHNNSTTGPYYQGEGTSVSNPRAVRYASVNAADNMATKIRQDTTIRPVLFVIGLNQPSGEPLDADWLARVANDPSYKDSYGASVYQTGQTAGAYYNVSASGLESAFQSIAAQVLRLSQ